MSDSWVEVTPDQARAMLDEIEAVIDAYRTAGAGDPGARRLHVFRVAFPLEPDDVPAGPDDDPGAEA